jgi:hypothetical protein
LKNNAKTTNERPKRLNNKPNKASNKKRLKLLKISKNNSTALKKRYTNKWNTTNDLSIFLDSTQSAMN